MAVLSTGQTFASGDQVTATKLNDIGNQAVFSDPVDGTTLIANNSTYGVSGGNGKLKVKDAGITSTQLATDAVITIKIQDGAVTSDKLDAGAVSVLMPTGSILPYAGSSAPTGYFLCDGSAKARQVNAVDTELFIVLGLTYGAGDGTTTYNIPDLRGRVIAGHGGTLLSGSADAIGDYNAHSTKTHTLSTAEMQHTNTTPTQAHYVSGGTGGITAPFAATTGNIAAITATAHNNVQPTIILNYIIKT